MPCNARLVPTVLLAEDVHRSGLRKLPRNLFCDWGFCVLEAAHGLEAWHQARKCEGRIDLLIAEQNLPFMGGLELAAHVRKLFPSVKVLLILQETTAFCRVSPSLADCRWRRKRVPFWRRSGPLPGEPFGVSLSLFSGLLCRTARSRQGRAVVGRGEANP